MKKETRLLRRKALNSLTLSIQHFNGLWDVGRTDAVLLLLDHSFEMLLKAAILHRGGRIRERGNRNTIGFDACVRRGLSDATIAFLTEEQALTLQTINGLRDAAQHHLIELSEPHLYLHPQAGLTLFSDLYTAVFEEKLGQELPERTLPVSTVAQVDPVNLFAQEPRQVALLLKPGVRRRTEAAARLRPLAILDATIRGEKVQPGEPELRRLSQRLAAGSQWESVLPGISAVSFVADGHGPNLSLRLTKKEGIPIHLVPEGRDGSAVVAVKRVNELDFYNLSHRDLAKKVGLTSPKTTAAVRYLRLEQDPDCYKNLAIGKVRFKRYSQRAIEQIKEALREPGIDMIWASYRSKGS